MPGRPDAPNSSPPLRPGDQPTRKSELAHTQITTAQYAAAQRALRRLERWDRKDLRTIKVVIQDLDCAFGVPQEAGCFLR